MKALIIAAGFCTRLYPVTEYFPKGLLPVAGTPIIQYAMDGVAAQPDITQLAIVTNHRYARTFSIWANSTYPNRRIQVVDNGVTVPEKRLGAIGDLLYSVDRLKWDDDIVVLASDTLVSLDWPPFLDFFRRRRGVVTAVYRTSDRSEIAGRLGCATIDGDRLVGFVEKPAVPPSDYIGVPYYVFPREALPLIRAYRDSGRALDAPGAVLTELIGKIPTYAFTVSGYYYDIGTIESYNGIAGSFRG
jgi:glucose-1-phosphate thymidylyltransferase